MHFRLSGDASVEMLNKRSQIPLLGQIKRKSIYGEDLWTFATWLEPGIIFEELFCIPE